MIFLKIRRWHLGPQFRLNLNVVGKVSSNAIALEQIGVRQTDANASKLE
jgi:hypothetical protein